MSKFTFPFEVVLKQNDKELFVQNVEKILVENLQSDKSFGCRILNCHTHVGSKKHLDTFIEAELLFHNSYYNKGFAYLTIKLIYNKIKEFKKIAIVGYEAFSELYLCETIELLKKVFPKKQAQYYVVETAGKKLRVRYTEKNFIDDSTMVVFIVPINTTLTTHDKMMSAFEKEIKLKIAKKNTINIGLIMIGPKEKAKNGYWHIENEKERVILIEKEKQNQLAYLDDRSVHFFAFVNVDWHDARECKSCFPDLDKNATLIHEKTMFEVNRASIVPMLQLGTHSQPEPFDDIEIEKENRNINNIVDLSKFLVTKHIVRNGNHFQYYFKSQEYFEHLKKHHNNLLKDWAQFVTEGVKICESGIVYDFLVAPRHYSNAGFVTFVNEMVFGGAARILYFDVSREYRDNIRAKYSDFSQLVLNIIHTKQKSIVRFHFVDDTIFSSNTFMRTKSLINTLIKNDLVDNNEFLKIELFSSIIILIGRNSKATKTALIEDSNFYEYVHVAISPMRNHEDACTLCQQINLHDKLIMKSATNSLSQSLYNSRRDYLLTKIEDLEKDYTASIEMRLDLITKHLLTQRLNNAWYMKKGEVVINKENVNDIYSVINDFYNHLHKWLNSYFSDIESIDFKLQTQLAIIRIITKPFFTYHIRQKQASFSFCIKLLDESLTNKKANRNIINVLIAGLTDLNANYLIRAKTISKLLTFFEKKLYDSEELMLYYKSIKSLVGNSTDDSKGLLLEYILVQNNESKFFGKAEVEQDVAQFDDVENKDVKNFNIALFLENNTIISDGFSDIMNNSKILDDFTESNVLPYYLEKFQNFFEISGINIEEQKQIFANFGCLKLELEKKKYNLNSLSEALSNLFIGNDVNLFLENKNELLLSDKYIYLNTDDSNNAKANKFGDYKNLENINDILRGENSILNTLFIGANCYIVKVQIGKQDNNQNKDAEADSESILLQIVKSELVSETKILFLIKIFLTLRTDFLSFIKEINLSSMKNQIYILKQKKALAIDKATKHHLIEYYEGREGIKREHDIYLASITDTPTLFIDYNLNKYYKSLYDKKLQLLINQFISSFYKKMAIESPENMRYKSINISKAYDLDDIGFYEHIFDNEEIKKYEMIVPNKNNKSVVKVIIIWHKNSFEDKKSVFIEYSSGNISSIIYLVLGLASNAGWHYRGSKECIVHIYAKEEYLYICNHVSDNCDENSKSDEEVKKIDDEINKSVKHNSHRPPWEFTKVDQKITLWSLYRYFELVTVSKNFERFRNKFSEDSWIKAESTNGLFKIRLKMLYKK